MSQFNILVNQNQCEFTGIETLKLSQSINNVLTNEFYVLQFTDKIGRNRFIIQNRVNNNIIAAILFDENNTCLFRETVKEYRLQGYQNNLLLLAAVKLDSIKHSDYLTKQGKKLIK